MRTIRISALAMIVALLGLPALAQQDVISTVIGGGPSDMPATDANLSYPVKVAFDSAGNYYIAAASQNRVFKVNGSTGLLTVVAGNGLPGYSGDSVTGGAASAELNNPEGVAVDSAGNVYIADTYNQVIRKVDTTNTITTIVGNQAACGGATAKLCYPQGLATDAGGNLYIADSSDCQVKKVVLATNTVSIAAGNGTCGYAGDGSLATAAELNSPSAVAIDSSNDIFIADTSNCVIREIVSSAGNKIRTVAGDNALGCTYNGDGISPTSATLYYPNGVAVNSSGSTVTIADTYNYRIRQFTFGTGSAIQTVAGSGTPGFCGDGAAANAACIYNAFGVALAGSGAFYIADDSNSRVRSFTVGGNINTVAGNGSTTIATPTNGVVPSGVTLYNPWGVYQDPSGNIFVGSQADEMVRELVQSAGVVNAFAGTGTAGFAGDGGLATAALMNNPAGIARDSSGNIYIADQYNCVVRMVNTAGVISVFAGIEGTYPSCGYSGDGGPATSAQLSYANSVYVDSKNNVFISDSNNQVVREVTNGIITTIAGIPGQAGYGGDGGPATSAKLNYPSGIAKDGAGNLYIADQYNLRVREINAVTGVITTFAGNGGGGFSGDGIATQNSLYYPTGVWADVNGNVFIADQANERLRWVNAAGMMTTVAGSGAAGYTGDGGVAISSELYYPDTIWEDGSGNLLFSDEFNYRVRAINAFAALNSSSGSLSFPLLSVGATSPAQQVTISSVGPLTFSNISITGDFSEYDDCPSSLPNASTCTMYVYFSPKASGVRTGTITLSTNGFFSNSSTINLTGTGTSISLTGSPANFGSILVKTTSATKTVTVKNNGSTAITMGAISLTETTDFAITSNTCPASGSTLAAKGSCVISLTFTPQSTGTKKGAIIINDSDPTSPQIAGVIGAGISNVSLAPTSIAFPSTPVGTTSPASKVTLTNKTGVSLTLGTPALSVSGPFILAASSTCTNGLVIAVNGTCTINVQFKPTALGFASGTLNVFDSDVTSPQTVALSGTGTSLAFSPASINFGTVTKGTQVSKAVTLNNLGSTPVTLNGYDIAGTASADFFYSSSCPTTLGAGQNCTITLYWTPSITGTEKATFKVYDNAQGSPQLLPLTGTGQ